MREIITVKMLLNLNFFVYIIKIWNKRKDAGPIQKQVWLIHENGFAKTNQDYAISYKRENSKMFNMTSKYLSIFKNMPTTEQV